MTRALTQLDVMLLTGSTCAADLGRLQKARKLPRPDHPATTVRRPLWTPEALRTHGYGVPDRIGHMPLGGDVSADNAHDALDAL